MCDVRPAGAEKIFCFGEVRLRRVESFEVWVWMTCFLFL